MAFQILLIAPHRSEFCGTKSAQLSGATKLVTNSFTQPRFSNYGFVRGRVKGEGLTSDDQSQSLSLTSWKATQLPQPK